MEIQGYNLPDDLHYEENHFWIKEEGDLMVMGMDDFAQQMAGEIVYVQLPNEGKKLTQGKKFAKMESGKWLGKVYSPVSGELVEVNEELETAICSVAEKGYYFTPEIARAMQKRLVRLDRMADETGPFAALSREDLECLHHWMKGLTAKKTGDAMNKSKDAVKGYRKAIYAKTGCGSLAELVQWARDNGMVVE